MSDGLFLWIGESKRPVKIDRKNDSVMDSVINYYDSVQPRMRYTPGSLFLDSGAFTARQKGIILDRQRVASIQETFKPQRAVPLDYPFSRGMSVPTMSKLWQKTKDNIVFWQDSTKIGSRIVPVLHAWDKNSLPTNLRWLEKKADADMIMLGSLFNSDHSDPIGFFGDRQIGRALVDMISAAIRAIGDTTDFQVHVTGFGSSPLTLHIAYYLGASSTDSAGYRRKAAYGKIILPGTGERYISNREPSFGNTKIITPSELELLDECECPICSSNPSLLVTDWKARAIHNEHVIKNERVKALRLLQAGEEAYEKYLDEIFSRSSLRYVWEYAKLKKHYVGISDSLFKRR